MTQAPDTAPSQSRGVDYETSDVPPRKVVIAIGLLFVLVGLSAAFVAWLLAELAPSPNVRASVAAPQFAPAAGPPLETSRSENRTKIEAAAARHLEFYGWSDQVHGRVHIPIDAAMQRLAQQGWPAGDTSGSGPP